MVEEGGEELVVVEESQEQKNSERGTSSVLDPSSLWQQHSASLQLVVCA